MSRTVGYDQTEQVLIRGDMLSAAQAKELSLVDQVIEGVECQEELLNHCVSAANNYLKSVGNQSGRRLTKLQLRESFARSWAGFAEEEADLTWQLLNRPQIMNDVGATLKRLSGQKPATSKL